MSHGVMEWTSPQERFESRCGTVKFSDGICKYLPLTSCSFVEIMRLLFQFLLSYGIVGKPGAGIVA